MGMRGGAAWLGLVALLRAGPAWGGACDPARLAPWTGVWAYAGDAAEREARMAAIEAVVQRMPILFWPFARSRIDAATPIPPRVVITVTGGQIRIGDGGADDLPTPCGGPARVWTTPDGAQESVTRTVSGLTLRHDAVQRDGGGTDEYILGSSGLTVRTTITSDQLPGPIRYTLTYRR